MKKGYKIILGLLVFTIFIVSKWYGYNLKKESKNDLNDNKPAESIMVEEENGDELEEIVETFSKAKPTEWGEHINGVVDKIDTHEKVVFLTFDACGGEEGSLYDEELIEYLKQEKIKATLFINGRWIDKNLELFKELSSCDLFEIENHGYRHKPLSVNGNEVYGIKGTESIEEVYKEVQMNNKKIEELTGRKPKFFRAGTAYYDNVAIGIANELGQAIGGFTFTGDAGATFSKEEVVIQAELTEPGSIILYHMNQPNSDTYEGLLEVIPILKEKGYKFGKLEDYY